jgi:hypothetical protein
MTQHSSHARPAAIETRLIAVLPMSTWISGLVLAGALTAPGLVLHALEGVDLIVGAVDANPHMAPQTHVTILCSILLAYGLAAARWVGQHEQPNHALTRADWIGSRLSGAAGVIVGLIVIFVTTRQIYIQEPDRNPWNVGEIYVDLLSLLLLWGIGRAVFFTVRGTGLAEYGNLKVDLWDITPLYRYGRQGLRRALAWSVGISLFVIIMYFDPNPELQIDSGKILGAVVLAGVATAALSLFWPLWNLRALVCDEKSHAMEAIDAGLLSIRQNAARGIVIVPGVEADLLMRRLYVMSVPDWPIDTGMLRRLGFYALVPTLSWFVGPVMREAVNNIFFAQIVRNVLQWVQ